MEFENDDEFQELSDVKDEEEFRADAAVEVSESELEALGMGEASESTLREARELFTHERLGKIQEQMSKVTFASCARVYFPAILIVLLYSLNALQLLSLTFHLTLATRFDEGPTVHQEAIKLLVILILQSLFVFCG